MPRDKFEMTIGQELWWLGWSLDDAINEAARVLAEFLTSEGIAFGHEQYDWTRSGARILAREWSRE